MAQFWLEIASAADLSQLAVVTTGTLDYYDDEGTPTARFASTTAVGDYVRAVGVPSASAMIVRALFRQLSSSSGGGRSGPAARVSGADGYIYGKNTSTTYRMSKSVGGVWTELASNLNSQPAGNTWGWMEMLVSGTTLEGRNWGIGAERPETANRTATDTSLTSGFPGFGMSGAIEAVALLRILAIGTDGDPAPTGPVGGRQRSRLILTPW